MKLTSEKEGESSLNKTDGELNQLYSAFEGLHLILKIQLTSFIFFKEKNIKYFNKTNVGKTSSQDLVTANGNSEIRSQGLKRKW